MKRKKINYCIFFIFLNFSLKAQSIKYSSLNSIGNVFSYDNKSFLLLNDDVLTDLSINDFFSTVKLNSCRVNSNLDYLGMNLTGFTGGAKLGYKNFGLGISGSGFSAPEVTSNFGKVHLINKNLNGSGISVKIFYETPNSFLRVEPFYSFNNFKFDTGDLYSFYGNISVPYNGIYGINLFIHNSKITGFIGVFQGNIFNSNESEVLFSLDVKYWYAAWNGTYSFNNFNVMCNIDYFGGNLKSLGVLSKDNQRYLAFPYDYLIINLDGNLNIINTNLGANYKFNNSDIDFGVSNALCINHSLNINKNYKYKNLPLFKYDGSSGNEYKQLNGISKIDLLIPYVNLNLNLNLGKAKITGFAQKKFYIPIISDTSENENSEDPIFDKEKISLKEYLLSGFSLGLKICL